MEEYLPLIIQLVSGGLGGITAGKLAKNLSLGFAGNAISGILGGFGGGKLGMLGPWNWNCFGSRYHRSHWCRNRCGFYLPVS